MLPSDENHCTQIQFLREPELLGQYWKAYADDCIYSVVPVKCTFIIQENILFKGFLNIEVDNYR